MLDSMMDANNRRFLLLMVNKGIVQPNEYESNYPATNDNEKRIFPLLDDNYEPKGRDTMPNGSNLYVMIIDARENKTYCYNATISRAKDDYDPLETDDLIRQLHTVFEGFYFSKPGLERW